MQLIRDFSPSALIAGFVAVLVGFTSSAVLVFQAAKTLQATPAEIASWMCALGFALGLTSIFLSLRFRVPVLTFLVTASGITLAGIGSAFWGLLAGVATLLVLRTKLAPAPAGERLAPGPPRDADDSRHS